MFIISSRQGPELVPCFIDFGLSSVAALAEDKAVDLYVMERALEASYYYIIYYI